MFYKILHINKESEENIKAEVWLDETHELFRGHFPGQPVLPGACMVQLLKEILEEALQYKLVLTKASNIKFLSVVDPCVHSKITYTIQTKVTTEGLLSVESQLWAAEVSSMKFSGIYKIK